MCDRQASAPPRGGRPQKVDLKNNGLTHRADSGELIQTTQHWEGKEKKGENIFTWEDTKRTGCGGAMLP